MSPAGAAILTARRSTRFVAWVRAWRAGLVPYDEIAQEIADGEEHLVVTDFPDLLTGVADVTDTWTGVSLRAALAALSRLHPDEIRLVLPAPGDPRGLPGPGPFSDAALVVGEGVLAGPLGVVPELRTHTSGSGDTFSTVLWRMYAVDQSAVRCAEPTAAEAESELATVLTESTDRLARLDIAQWRPELSGALAALRRPDNGTDLPPGFDPRARRLYARASVLDQVLALAEHTAPGGAINGYEAQQRDEALRPLVAACRRALVAACNAPLAP